MAQLIKLSSFMVGGVVVVDMDSNSDGAQVVLIFSLLYLYIYYLLIDMQLTIGKSKS